MKWSRESDGDGEERRGYNSSERGESYCESRGMKLGNSRE